MSQLDACVNPWCDWSAREGTAALRLVFRPAHWLTLDLIPSLGTRYRPAALANPRRCHGPGGRSPDVVLLGRRVQLRRDLLVGDVPMSGFALAWLPFPFALEFRIEVDRGNLGDVD